MAATAAWVGDIGDNGERLDAELCRSRRRGARFGLVASDDGDIGAGFRKPARHAKADAAVAASDKRDLAAEIE